MYINILCVGNHIKRFKDLPVFFGKNNRTFAALKIRRLYDIY